MSTEVLLGALLSIPIGVGTGLAVTPIQRWFESRGKAKAEQQTKRTAEEYKEVLFYRQHPNEFTQYLVWVAIRTTLIGAAVDIFSGFFFTLGHFLELESVPSFGVRRELLWGTGYLIGQLVAVLSSVLIVRICLPAVTLWRRVRHFEDYLQGIPASIKEFQGSLMHQNESPEVNTPVNAEHGS